MCSDYCSHLEPLTVRLTWNTGNFLSLSWRSCILCSLHQLFNSSSRPLPSFSLPFLGSSFCPSPSCPVCLSQFLRLAILPYFCSSNPLFPWPYLYLCPTVSQLLLLASVHIIDLHLTNIRHTQTIIIDYPTMTSLLINLSQYNILQRDIDIAFYSNGSNRQQYVSMLGCPVIDSPGPTIRRSVT